MAEEIKIYTRKEHLVTYKNDWESKLMARLIDLVHDEQTKERDEKALVLVQDFNGMYKEVPVQERIDKNKLKIIDALDIIKAIDTLLVDIESESIDFQSKYLAEEKLKIIEEAEIVSPITTDDLKS